MAKTVFGDGRWRVAMWVAAGLMLMAPLVAMQFTREVNWSPSDFMIFGLMLLVACGGFEIAARARGDFAYRLAAAITIGAAFLLVWANLAVGFIGDEANPANLSYFGVLLIGLAAGALARFRARRLTHVLTLMAIAQISIPIIAQASEPPVWVISIVFVGAWLLAAALFSRAARREQPGVTA